MRFNGRTMGMRMDWASGVRVTGVRTIGVRTVAVAAVLTREALGNVRIS